MQLPLRRFTVRLLISMVAVAGLTLWACKNIIIVIAHANDEIFKSSMSKNYIMNVSNGDSIYVDIASGSIQILPSNDEKVRMAITFYAATKQSQTVADEALATSDLTVFQDDACINVKSNVKNIKGVINEVNLQLFTPRISNIDIRTGNGCIYVGRRYINGVIIHSPITANMIRATNDSEFQSGYSQGNIAVECNSSRDINGDFVPTRLQLKAPGQIDIIAQLASVDVYAWHGTPPLSWPSGAYESQEEGRVSFEGTFALGENWITAAHVANISFSNVNNIRIDAEASNGRITGNLDSLLIESSGKDTRCNALIGKHPNTSLRLRTADGPISLLSTAHSN